MLLSWRQEPLPHLAAHDLQAPPGVDAALPHLPEVRDAMAVEAALARAPATPAPLRVQLVGTVPATAKGVGVFDDRTGSLLAWLPVAGRSAEGRVLAGEHTLCLADRPESARRSYLARTRCRVRADQDNVVELPVALHAVRIDVEADAQRSNAGLALQRADDPDWRLGDGTVLRQATGGALDLMLPAGRYLLRQLGGSTASLEFQVPTSATVTADFRR